MSHVTALAPWFGSNRRLAPAVGEELEGSRWIGVPFGGGMCELRHFDAAEIVVCDLHRAIINLANVVRDDELRANLIRFCTRTPFHPDILDDCQERCKVREKVPYDGQPDFAWACDYFMAAWMGRSGMSGSDDEFTGRLSTRWNTNGGSSNVRYRSAIRGLVTWGRIMRRCSFSVLDVFEFLKRIEDSKGHSLYVDPPFPGAGRRYKHNAGGTDQVEIEWHTRLAAALKSFKNVRIVCRFYRHPLIDQLYEGWTFRELKGRKQSNADAPELLIINGESFVRDALLF